MYQKTTINKLNHNMMKLAFSILAGLLFFLGCTPDTDESPKNKPQAQLLVDDGGLDLYTGFRATVVADSTYKNARHIAVNDNGDIYLKIRSDKTSGILALRDTTGDGKVNIRAEFSAINGTGMDIYNGYLYASSKTEVFRYKLNEGALLPDTTAEVVISGFPEQSQHAAKSFTFDDNGHIYVNVGAPSNACMENLRTTGSKGQDPCPQRTWQASIWQFDAEKLGQTQQEHGHQYCTGIRNCVALDWNHHSNGLFAVMHGRDQLSMFWPDFYDDKQNAELPSEEFLQIDDGDDFGWPFCYHDPEKNLKVLAPEYGGDGNKIDRCAEKKDPVLGFPAHYAPNDLLFYRGDQFPERYKNGAFVAFHGSWNRAPEPQKGYLVAFVPFRNGLPTGEWEVFADGFSGVKTIASTGDAKHRPMGLAEGPDGSLYITDSAKGKIWRITYNERSI
ncbi:MAG: sorbosone dehydrogenase [Bacteroidetes bacterium]|nr:MAG: sorbosone dehydrogenase [Bacteroidota bacterium]